MFEVGVNIVHTVVSYVRGGCYHCTHSSFLCLGLVLTLFMQ